MQPIQLRFSYTEAEYLNAARTLILAEKTTVARLIAIFVLLVMVMLLLPILAGFTFPLWIGVLFALAFDALFAYQLIVQIPRRFFRGDPKMRDEYRLTFSDEGVWLQTSQIDSKMGWSLYKRVLENKSLYIIVYGRDTRMMTVIPKRVFRDVNEELEFRQLLRRHVDQRLPPTNATISAEMPSYTPSTLEPLDWR